MACPSDPPLQETLLSTDAEALVAEAGPPTVTVSVVVQAPPFVHVRVVCVHKVTVSVVVQAPPLEVTVTVYVAAVRPVMVAVVLELLHR